VTSRLQLNRLHAPGVLQLSNSRHLTFFSPPELEALVLSRGLTRSYVDIARAF